MKMNYLKLFFQKKLRYCEKATKFDIYSVTSKQVEYIFKFLWPFRKTWILSFKLYVRTFLPGFSLTKVDICVVILNIISVAVTGWTIRWFLVWRSSIGWSLVCGSQSHKSRNNNKYLKKIKEYFKNWKMCSAHINLGKYLLCLTLFLLFHFFIFNSVTLLKCINNTFLSQNCPVLKQWVSRLKRASKTESSILTFRSFFTSWHDEKHN